MKVYFEELKLETTLEDVCSTFDLGDEDEVIKELSANTGYFEVYGTEYVDDVVGEMSIDPDTKIINFDIITGGNFAIIDEINTLGAAKNDPLLMIVKDEVRGETPECETCTGEGEIEKEDKYIDCEECEGTGGNEEMLFISFEAINNSQKLVDPPPLKGGEYDEKFILSEKELEQYNEMDTEITDVKYQEFFFERVKNYEPGKWSKLWLESNQK